MSARAVNAAKQTRGLVVNSFAAIVMLLIEYGLGVWVNLYGKLPDSDKGVSAATGFGRAITDGPVGLSIHAVFGLLLLATAITALVRSISVRRPGLVVTTAVGLLAVVGAGVSGSSFVGDGANGSSMTMAVLGGVAIGAYALVCFLALFLVAGRPVPSRH